MSCGGRIGLMKVLHINSVCGIRSTGRICTDIADALTTKNYQCKIAYGRETVPLQYSKYAVKIGKNFDEKIHVVMARFFDASGFASKRATHKFIKWIKEYDPDVIHLHNIHGYYVNVEILFSYLRTSNKKIIWTLHDCWAFTGHCGYFEVANCNQWQIECKNCVQLKRYPKCVTKGNVKKNFMRKKKIFTNIPNLTIVTPSSWLADLVNKSFLSEYPIEIIKNGISKEIFKITKTDMRSKYNIKSKWIVLGVSTIWDRLKGYDDFLYISSKINEEYQIVLVGVTEKQIQELPTNIIGINSTNNTAELAAIYSAADVFVNPTYEDNYPTVNLEAQACGTPVITYQTGGSIESVPQSHWVKQGDTQELVDMIEKIVASDHKIINKITDKYECVEEYIKLYLS